MHQIYITKKTFKLIPDCIIPTTEHSSKIKFIIHIPSTY